MELQFLAKVFYKPISWLAEPQIFPAAMNVFPLLLPTVLTAYAQSDFHLGCLHRRFELHVATWKAQLAPPWKLREEEDRIKVASVSSQGGPPRRSLSCGAFRSKGLRPQTIVPVRILQASTRCYW